MEEARKQRQQDECAILTLKAELDAANTDSRAWRALQAEVDELKKQVNSICKEGGRGWGRGEEKGKGGSRQGVGGGKEREGKVEGRKGGPENEGRRECAREERGRESERESVGMELGENGEKGCGNLSCLTLRQAVGGGSRRSHSEPTQHD